MRRPPQKHAGKQALRSPAFIREASADHNFRPGGEITLRPLDEAP